MAGTIIERGAICCSAACDRRRDPVPQVIIIDPIINLSGRGTSTPGHRPTRNFIRAGLPCGTPASSSFVCAFFGRSSCPRKHEPYGASDWPRTPERGGLGVARRSGLRGGGHGVSRRPRASAPAVLRGGATAALERMAAADAGRSLRLLLTTSPSSFSPGSRCAYRVPATLRPRSRRSEWRSTPARRRAEWPRGTGRVTSCP